MAELTTDQVWREIDKQLFAVLGMVTARNEARTVGIVYVPMGRKLYTSSQSDAWKVRHIAQNPHVSLTIPIPKRILFLPWIKIPAATISLSGEARLLDPGEAPPAVIKAVFRGLEVTPETTRPYKIIEITPQGQFLTYGVGVSLWGMRDPGRARRRVAVT